RHYRRHRRARPLRGRGTASLWSRSGDVADRFLGSRCFAHAAAGIALLRRAANRRRAVVAPRPHGDRRPYWGLGTLDRPDPGPPRLNASGETAAISVFPTTSPQSASTYDLVKHLRTSVIPPVAQATNTTVYVGGFTASQVDFAHVLSSKLPLFIGVVILLSAL